MVVRGRQYFEIIICYEAVGIAKKEGKVAQ